MSGCIDIYGFANATGSELLCGWAPLELADGLLGTRTVSLVFEKGESVGEALVVGTLRDDLDGVGRGVALHVPGSQMRLGALRSVSIPGEAGPVELFTTPGSEHLSHQSLMERMRLQRLAPGGSDPERFKLVLERDGFDGRDTLQRLNGQVAFQVDEAVGAGADAVLLSGWVLSAPGAIRTVRLRSGGRVSSLRLDDAIRLDRPDVLAKHGEHLRTREVRCGFLLPVRSALEPGEPCYIEIETAHGDIGYHPLQLSTKRGLSAIQTVLAPLAPRYDQVQGVFDRIGPVLEALNADRLAGARSGREIRFGQPCADPVCSVIVPLHGRLDYMEVQVGLLAGSEFATRHELIYVVDDPASTGAAMHMADTLFRRFGIPLRLWLQNENLGFAPACNVGLGMATGRTVCFLNSDVFGHGADWLDRLVEDADRVPEIGIVGPLLLFEDGSLQHQGMGYEPLPEFGGWLFPTHPGKGERPDDRTGLVRERVITGACMVMTRELAQALGGFDEAFVIGDFEDSDLCLRARGLGVGCAVDHDVRLFHLERKSQVTAVEPWRLNVTLYNAWLHQKRWGRRLAGDAAAVPGDV